MNKIIDMEKMKNDQEKHITSFGYVSYINQKRSEAWHGPDSEPWNAADWGNAMSGEAGEFLEAIMDLVGLAAATNIKAGKMSDAIKKLRRHETGISQTKGPQSYDAAIREVKKEAADIFLYLDLTCTYLGFSLYDAVRDKFNEVSDREGFPHKI